MTKLVNHKIVITEDGSPTLHSNQFRENCHNKSGAYQETLFNYAQGCCIDQHLEHDLSILEVGFGTGLGPIVTYEKLKELNYKYTLTLYSLEIDINLINWAQDYWHEKKLFNNLKLLKKGNLQYFEGTHDFLKLVIFIGDATKTVPLAKEMEMIKPVQAIYQDAFSPAKNPTLWTPSWFKLLRELASPDVMLSTYSCARIVKDSLKEAGWSYKKVGGFATKRDSLRASLNPKILDGV